MACSRVGLAIEAASQATQPRQDNAVNNQRFPSERSKERVRGKYIPKDLRFSIDINSTFLGCPWEKGRFKGNEGERPTTWASVSLRNESGWLEERESVKADKLSRVEQVVC